MLAQPSSCSLKIILLISVSFSLAVKEKREDFSRLQGIHVLDPGIGEFKYYSSWNSDQWIHWVRQRYVQDLKKKLQNDTNEQDEEPIYGVWVNIILITSSKELNAAFSDNSMRAYPKDDSRKDYIWSDVAFPVYVVIRKVSEKRLSDEKVESEYNVYNCGDKKMFVNAKVDPNTFYPTFIQTFFPKKVKNPKSKLRIPLVACQKVSQVRGLLDEIKFQLGS